MGVDAAIFDMDGLLVDSEPLWTRAEIEIFASVGISLDDNACAETVGTRLDQVVELRYTQKPWDLPPTKTEISRRILKRVMELVRAEGKALPGAKKALETCKSHGAKLALASSSSMDLIGVVLETLGLTQTFDHVQSASGLTYGKPHPEVYLLTAQKLGVKPKNCLAFEDSIPGLIAAKAASMQAVAVPERRHQGDPSYAFADVVLTTLEEVDGSLLRRFE